MELFRNASIKRKLISITMITCVATLLLVCGTFLAYEWFAARDDLSQDLETLAEVIGDNSTAALAFRDQHSAEMTLSALKNDPHIVSSVIYTADDTQFAAYRRAGAQEKPFPEVPGQGCSQVAGHIEIFQDIALEGESLGTVYIQSDMIDLRMRMLDYAAIAASVMLAAILMAFLITTWLQRLISEPILQLAETARAVSDEGDYGVRAKRFNSDEVGQLIDAFNDMLGNIQQRDEELARSNAELQDFAYVASHDLQEPLRKIQAFGDRLKTTSGTELSDQGNDYLARMQNAAARMTILINDLLSFSRVTTKARPFEKVDMTLIAKEVVSDLETRIEETGGTVRLGDLPEIEAEPLQMRQLLQNLIGNALKFHREGATPLVEVEGHLLQPGDGHSDNGSAGQKIMRLTVKDNGIGFDEKYTDRIFGIFQRLHGRNSYAGTGVGLAICRKIVDRHKGEIFSTSAPGKGATFIVDLPTREAGEISPL